jgi:Alpha/beta hydrolase of unknown function (DUF900)
MASFTNSYLLSNRAFPREQSRNCIYPSAPGTLFFFMAPGQYNSNANAYRANPNAATLVIPPAFAAALEKDLKVASANGCPQLTLYVHGLGNYFTDTCNELGTYGTNLLKQGYKGLVIGFDWPSYGVGDSYFHYGSLPYSFPPTNTSGTIRDNINGSIDSFVRLLSYLAYLCKKNNAKLNFICHSEGNYMLMLGMYQLAFPTPFINQSLLLAADINTGALQVKSYSPPWSGQLSTLGPYATGTTVYWSSQDDVLPSSDGWTTYHNPSFSKRLGLHGPASFNVNSDKGDQLMSNTYSLDCSLVVNRTVMNKNGVPPSVTVHSGYFYIPQVLQDMAQTLTDVAPSRVVNRKSAGAPDGRAYIMELDSNLLTGPITPSGESVETSELCKSS